MKETIQVFDYAERIGKALPRGILLNTGGDGFNSMVIGWGHLGLVWSLPTFVVYVREHRYTKARLDKTREFTVSVPLGDPDPEITRICGTLSGRDTDKAAAARLTLEAPRTIGTPGIAEYPLTLECRVLYAQAQVLADIPEEIRRRMYPQDLDSSHPLANRDAHTAYIGQIVDAYIIRPEETFSAGDASVTLRAMAPADYDQVWGLWMSCKNMGFNTTDDSREGVEKLLRRNPGTSFVALSGDRVIGVILAGQDGRRGYIYHACTAEAWRGRGIASRLVQRALDALKQAGIHKVALLVFQYNEAGNAFWEKMGFTRREDVAYRNRLLSALVRIDT